MESRREDSRKRIRTVAQIFCHVMKISDEESLLLTGEKTYEAAADQFLQMGPKLVAVTLGSEGVLIAFGERKERIAGFQVKSVDTTGAGDSFWGGFLSAYLEFRKPVEELSWNNFCTADQILETLRSMQMTLLNTASGYIPSYTRTELTDALHKIFDFRTDNEFISKSDMRTLIKNTKQIKSK